jgi:hypothetical protein
MRASILSLAFALAASSLASAQKFFPDDPLWEEPPQRPAYGPEPRTFSEVLEAISNFTGNPGERHPVTGVIPARGVNTLGEVMDGPWYANRHGRERMSREAILEGAGTGNPPSTDGKWRALLVKPYGLRPGILMRDRKDDVYLLRFDPRGSPEMATGAEMVSSRIFHALGYHVPQNYLVTFERSQLVASDAGEGISSAGARRALAEEDIDAFLGYTEADGDGRYRAVATLAGRGTRGLLGPYQVFGTRSDDPNDVVPHEHRRDLRGLFVFSAWLNHNYMRALNTMDIVVEPDGVPYVRHWLIDFTATLGSGGPSGVKQAWEGNETIYPRKDTLNNLVGFGIVTPGWMRARYPSFDAVGKFGYQTFDPETWTTNHDIAPFSNRLPDDEFWAAKQVMGFTDEDIRALVSTGQYSDPEAAEWIARCLIERRNRIGRTYFEKVLPLDRFRVENGRLDFEDLKAQYGFAPPREYAVRWLELENESGVLTLITGATSPDVPRAASTAAAGSYYAARISGDDPEMEVTVYLRKEQDGFDVVGIERGWPGKVIADPAKDQDTGRNRYDDLEDEQKALFDEYAKDYAVRRGREVTPEEYFNSLTISERTTFDAVTHALINSRLTDEQGNSLGSAVDLIAGIERIAGQYYGRAGDQQFRLYVYLAPGAKETLEKSREFHVGNENTVYHVGYPMSFRQDGKEPTIQFSISEDGSRADIDVDYRSSKSPQALFNGHLTSANSDVRAGDNLKRHNGRWQGFVGWWQDVFGSISVGQDQPRRDLIATELPETPTVLPPDRPPGAPIDAVQDAVQEFLTDWIVRRKYAEALDFLSPQAYACLNLDDDMRDEALDAASARKELETLMRYAVKELGRRPDLTAAIDAVEPWNKERPVEQHAFESDFMLTRATEGEARQYLCGQPPPESTNAEYYGVLFRFKKQGSAVLGLLWRREDAASPWRIVSYRTFEQ